MLRGTMYFYRDCIIPRRIVEALDILGSGYIVPRRIVDALDIFLYIVPRRIVDTLDILGEQYFRGCDEFENRIINIIYRDLYKWIGLGPGPDLCLEEILQWPTLLFRKEK